MLIAEVVDNHYVRAAGAMCYGVGAVVCYPWIFRIDAPKLAELPDGAQRLQFAALAFWIAIALAVLQLGILITRLILDKIYAGRPPARLATAPAQVELASAPATEPLPVEPAPLQAIPVDQTPLLGAQVPAVAVRIAGPVRRLVGVGGVYQGSSFELTPGGALSVGRQGAAILLENDNQVSRQHAQIDVTPDGLATLRDTGSTNGTWVNNQRVTEQQLAPGDLVQIGTSQFKVEA
jgi:hypothetical protein